MKSFEANIPLIGRCCHINSSKIKNNKRINIPCQSTTIHFGKIKINKTSHTMRHHNHFAYFFQIQQQNNHLANIFYSAFIIASNFRLAVETGHEEINPSGKLAITAFNLRPVVEITRTPVDSQNCLTVFQIGKEIICVVYVPVACEICTLDYVVAFLMGFFNYEILYVFLT
jgi:hypothetical protein